MPPGRPRRGRHSAGTLGPVTGGPQELEEGEPGQVGGDVERDVTVLVKTFERPDCLQRLVASIRRFYPRIPVFVIDDSARALAPVPEGVTRYWHLPYDSLGLAGGRNFGLRQVETPYVLVSDDDMVFGRKTDLARMLHALETTRFDLVSCLWMDHDPWRSVRLGVRRSEATLEIADGTFVRRLGVASGTVDGLPAFDLVHNFFVAPVERLGEDPWDGRLRHMEQNEFFLRLKQRGLLCTRLPDVVVYHHPQLRPEYFARRMDTQPYIDLWCREHAVDRRVVVCRLYSCTDTLLRYYPGLARYAARRALRLLSGRRTPRSRLAEQESVT
jgi:hypothetical protein